MSHQPKSGRTYVYCGLNIVAILALTLLFLNLVGSYWSFWKMGTPGNGLVLLFFYAPVILTLFSATSAIALNVASRLVHKQWQILLISFACMVFLFIAAFFLEVWHLRDYPRFKEGGMSEFLIWYWAGWRDALKL
jgi:hypothetical protein